MTLATSLANAQLSSDAAAAAGSVVSVRQRRASPDPLARALRWGVPAPAVNSLAAAIALQVAVSTEQPNQYAMDPARNQMQTAAIGLFIGGGVLTLLSSVMWMPHWHCCHHRPAFTPPLALSVTPSSVGMAFRFADYTFQPAAHRRAWNSEPEFC